MFLLNTLNYSSSSIIISSFNIDLSKFFKNEKAEELFKSFIKVGGIDFKLFKHQEQMLLKTLIEKKNCVITTGTGSGKTESYLLPLLAYLFNDIYQYRYWDVHAPLGRHTRSTIRSLPAHRG